MGASTDFVPSAVDRSFDHNTMLTEKRHPIEPYYKANSE